MTFKSIALILTLLWLSCLAYSQPTCSFQAGERRSHQEVSACIQAIPYDRDVAVSTIDTLYKSIQMYSFKDISRRSPDPVYLPVSVDVDAGLSEIANNSYPNDYQFQQAVVELFNSFKDAHTRYTKPNCHSTFVFTLGVSLASIDLNGQQSIIINDPKSPYNGLKVISIDDSPAVSYITKFGVDVCRDSLDISTRFNDALKVFTTRPQRNFAIPSPDSVTLNIDKIGSIVFPWMAYANANITDFNHLLSMCLPTTTEIRNGSIPYIDYIDDGKTFESREEKLAYHRSALEAHIKELEQQFSQGETLPTNVKASATDSSVIYSSVNMQFSLVQPGVGALKIPSFFPSEFGLDTLYSIKSIPQFLFDMQRVYVLAYEHGIKDLILDFRGNGGGWICLAMEFLRILFPGPAGSPPAGELFDIRYSELTHQLASQASKLPRDVYSIFSPWKYLDPNTMQPYNDTRWLVPGIMYNRGGVTSAYSRMVTDDCTMVDIPSWNPKFLFDPDHVLILSDGTCGSACALVARNIQERKQAKTLVVGGIKDRPTMVASFIGGLVYDLPTLLEEIKLLGLMDSPVAPKPFKTSAGLRFTLWEQYPWVGRSNPPIPSEFVFQASDLRMMYTMESLNNNQMLYKDAYKVWKRS